MLKTIEVVFDGTTFVPTEPVDLPVGTKASVSIAEDNSTRVTPISAEEAERILQGDGSPLPWATVEEAIAYSRGRLWPELDTEERP